TAYPALADVPITLGSTLPGIKPVALPRTYVPIPDNVADLYNYDFALELKVLEEVERAAQAAAAERVAREERTQRVEAERKERERRQAPGLDEGIMQPIQASGSPGPLRKADTASTSTSPKPAFQLPAAGSSSEGGLRKAQTVRELESRTSLLKG
ncbi:hypothetical protein HDV00_006292, partial [Rhizophlyctis rosea]